MEMFSDIMVIHDSYTSTFHPGTIGCYNNIHVQCTVVCSEHWPTLSYWHDVVLGWLDKESSSIHYNMMNGSQSNNSAASEFQTPIHRSTSLVLHTTLCLVSSGGSGGISEG